MQNHNTPTPNIGTSGGAKARFGLGTRRTFSRGSYPQGSTAGLRNQKTAYIHPNNVGYLNPLNWGNRYKSQAKFGYPSVSALNPNMLPAQSMKRDYRSISQIYSAVRNSKV